MTLSHVLAARCALMTLPLLVAGCSTGDGPAAAPSSSSSATATATTATVEQDAINQAVALIPTYWETVDGLFADPALPIDGLYQVAVDPEASSEAAAIQTFRSNGYLQSGTSRVVSTTVGSVDLETTGSASDLPSVSVTACIDVAQVGATDASGMSVAAADRAPYLISELTVVNIDYPDAASWRVSSAPNTQAQACPDWPAAGNASTRPATRCARPASRRSAAWGTSQVPRAWPVRGRVWTVPSRDRDLPPLRTGRLGRRSSRRPQLPAGTHHSIVARQMLAERMQRALTDRVLFEQATGVLAERAGVDAARASVLLHEQAARCGRTAGEVAAGVVADLRHA